MLIIIHDKLIDPVNIRYTTYNSLVYLTAVVILKPPLSHAIMQTCECSDMPLIQKHDDIAPCMGSVKSLSLNDFTLPYRVLYHHAPVSEEYCYIHRFAW